jgi:hypothetical protein
MSALIIEKPKTAIEKKTRTTVDTISVTAERIAKWKRPDGQRPLRENKKVRDLAEAIKLDGGVLPGIITLGVLGGSYWIIDGQHRLHSFGLSGVKEGYADVRYFHAMSMADICREYVELNSRLVTMRPDDFLRGLEGSIPALAFIRNSCPFVGYDQIHRNGQNATLLSMAVALRNWRDSQSDTPCRVANTKPAEIAEAMPEEDTAAMTSFLSHAYNAFGKDPEYARLWSSLNLTLCMWLYRRLVLSQYSQKTPRISGALFQKCLLSVSADSAYQDWLMGRRLSERDRGPAYARLKTIFARRLETELGKKVQLPAPSWT